LAIGADEAVRIDAIPSDGVFVAQEIAKYAKGQGFDIIFTGRESIDYNSGVVGPMISELLTLPLINVVTKVDVSGDIVTAERDIDGGREVVEAKLPVVLSAQKDLTEPRIPNMRGIMAARTKPLQVIAASNPATSEIAQYVPNKPKADCHFIDHNDIDSLVQLLRTEAKVI
jgi:electron transfer flavoprotein beta subunit